MGKSLSCARHETEGRRRDFEPRIQEAGASRNGREGEEDVGSHQLEEEASPASHEDTGDVEPPGQEEKVSCSNREDGGNGERQDQEVEASQASQEDEGDIRLVGLEEEESAQASQEDSDSHDDQHASEGFDHILLVGDYDMERLAGVSGAKPGDAVQVVDTSNPAKWEVKVMKHGASWRCRTPTSSGRSIQPREQQEQPLRVPSCLVAPRHMRTDTELWRCFSLMHLSGEKVEEILSRDCVYAGDFIVRSGGDRAGSIYTLSVRCRFCQVSHYRIGVDRSSQFHLLDYPRRRRRFATVAELLNHVMKQNCPPYGPILSVPLTIPVQYDLDTDIS